MQHSFISLEFLQAIHARDIAWGRTDDFLPEQLLINANPFLLPVWVAGLGWKITSDINGEVVEMVGWDDLTQQVAEFTPTSPRLKSRARSFCRAIMARPARSTCTVHHTACRR
ncbi:MAG: hypothetical protein ACOYYS_23290 [Chloroflexota bacterium]